MRAKVLGKSLFKKIWATLKDLPKYIPERLHWAVHYFLIILGNSLDNNLLNVNDKKKTTYKAMHTLLWCIYDDLSGKNISLEGQHLVLTLLASNIKRHIGVLCYCVIIYIFIVLHAFL